MSFDDLWFHLPSVATAATSEPASIGFARCSWNPALKRLPILVARERGERRGRNRRADLSSARSLRISV